MPDNNTNTNNNTNNNDEYMPVLKHLSSNPNNKEDISRLNEIKNDIMTKLTRTQDNIQNQTGIITNLNSKIDEKRQRLMRQEEEIAEKQKIILTRNRMLNLSQANNSYNNKIIYVLVSLIFAFFIIMLLMYVNKNKKFNPKGAANSIKSTMGALKNKLSINKPSLTNTPSISNSASNSA